MKKIIYLLSGLTLLTVASCRTTEANYRSAYEKAREKQTETGDSLTTAMLRKSQDPQTLTFTENDKQVALPVLTVPVTRKVDAGSQDGLQRYCVCVGKFKQIFNAKSMCERLESAGYPVACVTHDRQNYYYVVATSSNSPSEALQLLNKVNSDKSLSLHTPFPYILRPAHLIR